MDSPIPLYPYTILARSLEAAATDILSLFLNSYILERKVSISQIQFQFHVMLLLCTTLSVKYEETDFLQY